MNGNGSGNEPLESDGEVVVSFKDRPTVDLFKPRLNMIYLP